MKPTSDSQRGRGLISRVRRGAFKALMGVVQSTFIASTLLVMPLAVAPVAAANASANIDQCANGSDLATRNSGCNAVTADWVNGNLGASKSAYQEGDSIPYRLRFANLSTSGTHTVTIEWDTTKSSKHAIDYLTTYNRTVTNANPCLGVSGCVYPDSPATIAIPPDPQVTGAGVTPVGGVFTFWGASNLTLSAYSGGTGFPPATCRGASLSPSRRPLPIRSSLGADISPPARIGVMRTPPSRSPGLRITPGSSTSTDRAETRIDRSRRRP